MEIWKDIKGYEGYYQVSDLGAVRAMERTVLNKHGLPQRYPAKLLKFDVSDMGCSKYYRVTLTKEHKSVRFLVHRLVAMAFIPNPQDKEFINHIDNNGEHNWVSNLEWVTHSENMIHSQKQGRLFKTQSDAGKASGIVNKANLQKEINALVNKSVHAWTVLNGDLKPRGTKYYVLCQCVCGTIRTVETSRLRRGEAQGCSGRCSAEFKI